ncbi:hypothetical protein BVC80_1679g34 [Macleaya cordata]|uniref:Reverse transcriptase domain n=1 Tax=Macleaya cordata TaxID=56857 RepID=A0A200Q0S4_MACCD|nr:hypothetical protein BVC80_1679g34 [Macleaya cordata]
MFANDLLFFGKATKGSGDCLKEILTNYSSWSGQRINFNKSAIHFSKATLLDTKEALRETLAVNEMESSDRYLGNYLLQPKHLCKSFDFILQKFNSKLAGWKRNTLTHAKRTILCKATLATISNFNMSTNIFPAQVLDKITRYQRNFWWGHDFSDRKLHYIGWNTISKPIEQGGLNIRDASLVNKAPLGKLTWRFLTEPNALWVRLLKAKYLKNDDFWNHSRPSLASSVWAGLTSMRHAVKDGYYWSIGDGKKICIWEEP